MIYLLALILGLCIPLGILYLMEVLNTKVRGKKDIKDVKLPFVGEIPLSSKDLKASVRAIRKMSENVSEVVVKAGNRNTINEAFRVLRTNVEFMSKNGSNVIALTSFNPGSGKSFISMNLVTALAIKGKKVLAVDCDLRHASLSSYVNSPKHGISNYLSGQIDDVLSLACNCGGVEPLFVLPVGTISSLFPAGI